MGLSRPYYFRKLAGVQHYTKAAQEPYIAQPGLSAPVLSLERDLGIDLFQWEGRGMRPTKYGQNPYVRVCKALVELGVGIDNAKEDSGTIGGMIDMTRISTLCGDFLPRSINNCAQKCNPTIRFNVFNNIAPVIMKGARSDAYGTRFYPISEEETDLCLTLILSQKYMAIINSAHPLTTLESKPVELEGLESYEILTHPENSPVGGIIKKELRKHNLKTTHYGYDEITIEGYAAINQMIATVADTPPLKRFDSLTHLNVKLGTEVRLIYTVYHKNNYLTPAVKNYIQHVLDRGPEFGGASTLA